MNFFFMVLNFLVEIVFISINNACVLNEEGRKIFIESFEERLESVFMHPKLKRKVSYRTALKLDCYKLIKNILEEKEFVPFSLKEGM